MKKHLVILTLLFSVCFGLKAQNCDVPTNVTVTGTSDHSTHITWNYPGSSTRLLLYNNTNFINLPGEGYQGADVSSLYAGQSSLGKNATSPGFAIADDFTLTQDAQITSIDFFAYVENASITSSPIAYVLVKFYNQLPVNNQTTPVWTSTQQAPISCDWTGAYRTEDIIYYTNHHLDTIRPIFQVKANVNTTLPAGHYWVSVSFVGVTTNEVYGIPLVDANHVTTGDALTFNSTDGTWGPWTDDASHEQMGMPMRIFGYFTDNGLTGFNVYRNGTQVNTQLVETPYYDDEDTSMTALTQYCYTVKAVYTSCTSPASASGCGSTTADPCFVSTLPYTENFDDYGYGDNVLPNCWRGHTSFLGSANLPCIQPPTAATSYSLRLYASSSEQNYAVAPKINTQDLQLSDIVMCFKAYKTSGNASAQLVVGYVTDPDDYYSFVPIDTITPSATGVFEDFYYELSQYTGLSDYIAFRALNATIFIDDFKFLPVTCMHPSNLTIAEVGSDYVTIGWHAFQGTAPFTAQYKQSSEGSWNTVTGILDTTFTIYGLTVLENYSFDVIVRSECGTADNSISKTFTFSTTCQVSSVPYMENFDDFYTAANSGFVVPDCWNKANSGGTNYGYPYVSTSGSSNCKSLYRCIGFQSKPIGQTGQGDNYAVIPMLDAPLSTLTVRFFARTSLDTAYLIVGVVTNISDQASIMSSFTPYDTVLLFKGGFFYELPLTGISINGHLTLMSPKIVSKTNSFNIDNVEVFPSSITCRHPENIQLVGGSPNSLKVCWSPWDAYSTSYTLAYKSVDDYVWTEVPGITDTFYTVNGLVDNTKYEFKVKSHCSGSGSSTYSFAEKFKTRCFNPVFVPYSNDFEGENPLDCWAVTSKLYTAPGINSTVSQAHAGSKSLNIPCNYVWVSTPAIGAPIQDLTMSFYLARSASESYSGVLEIGISDNPMDTTNFELVSTLHLAANNTYYLQEVDFANVTNTGSNKYIVFRIRHAQASGNYRIDDLDIYYSTPCTTPTQLTATGITDQSATLQWHNDAFMTSCDLMYKSNFDNDWTIISNIIDSTYTLTGLVFNTQYTAQVRTTCSSGTSRVSPAVTFTTPCGLITNLPYNHNFDSDVTDSDPNCWTVNNTGTTASYIPVVKTNYHHSGSKSLYIRRSSNDSNIGWAVLPELDTTLSISDLQVSFYHLMPNGTNYNAMIGTMSDPNDFDTFTPWDTFAWPHYGEWQYHITRFNGYTGGDQYIAFVPGPYAFSMMYLDDILIERIPTCYKPLAVKVADMGNTWCKVSWNRGGTEQQWKVAYKEQNDLVWSYVTVSDTFCLLTGLTSSSTYFYKVCAVCSATDESEYTDGGTFTTYCDPLTQLPYLENFDTYGTGTTNAFPTCWIRNNTVNLTTKPYIATSSYSGVGGLYMTVNTNNYSIVCPPPLDTSLNMSDLKVSFKMRDNYYTSYYIIFGITDNPQDLNAFVPLDTIRPVYNTSNSWSDVVLYLSDYNLPGGRYLAIKKPFVSNGTNSSYAYIDDFCINTSVCSAPQNVAVTNIGSDWCEVSWPVTPMVQEWEYVYGPVGFTPEDSVPHIIDTNIAHIPGLDDIIHYEFYVRNICPNGDPSDWSMPVLLRVSCQPVTSIPYYEDFDSYGTRPTYNHSVFPNCWTKTGNANTHLSDLSLQYYYSWPGAMAISRTFDKYVYLSLPEITDTIAYLQLSFLGKFNTADGFVDVGVMTNPMDTSTFTLVESVHARSTVWNEFTVPLTSYVGTGHYITFRSKGSPGYDLYIDNLLVDNAPVCVKPVNPSISNIQLHSVQMGWTPGRLETSWQVAYGPQGFHPDAPGSSTYVTTTDNPVTITGLADGTFYDIYVRSACADSVYSEWSSVNSFRTRCVSIDSVPYYESFDSYGTGSNYNYVNTYPTCWDKMTNSSRENNHINWYPYLSTFTHADGNASLYFYTTGGQYCIGSMPPVGDNLSIDSLQVIFKIKGSSNTGSFQVGVMTNPEDTSTFTLVQTVTMNGNGWNEITVPFNNYTGTGKYIAFKMVNTSSGSSNYFSCFIDALSLVRIPTCIEPVFIESIGQTEGSITLSWFDTVSTQDHWQIAYGPSGFDLDMAPNLIIADTVPFTITGLAEGVDYDFYLRTYCSADDQSFWIAPITVRTACSSAKPLPYSENFDSYQGTSLNSDGTVPGCWFAYKEGSNINLPHIVNQNFNFTYPNALMMTARSNGANSYVVLPEFTDSLNRLNITFWKRMYNVDSTAMLTVGYMTDNMDYTTFVPLKTVTNVHDISGAFDTVKFYTFQNVPAHGYIAFRFSTNYPGQSQCGIDNVLVTNTDVIDCMNPSNLTVSNIGYTTATFSWTPGGDENYWYLEIWPAEEPNPIISGIGTDYTSINLNDLETNTEYIVRVKALCYGQWESDPSDTIHFRTLNDDTLGVSGFARFISLYPNPTNGQVTIHNSQFDIQNVDVYDVYGKLLKRVEVNGNHTRLDMTPFADGIYFIRIETEKGIVTKRLVKK